MKIKIIFTVCALLATSMGIATASDEVKFSMSRKTQAYSNTRSANQRGVVNRSTESNDIVYVITVESTSLKDLENITIEYNIYYEEAQPGSTGKPPIRTLSGKQTVERLASRKKTEFDTEAITIKETRLDGNYYWASGASNQVKDRVVGSVIKAFNSEGKLLGQYINPSNIATKCEWKTPR